MSANRNKDLAQRLAKRGWDVERDPQLTRVFGHREAPRSVWAFLMCGPYRPYVHVMDFSAATEGTGIGTRLIDDVVMAAREMRLAGLAFADKSHGYWDHYAKKRGLVLERGIPLGGAILETRLLLAQEAAA